MPEGYKIYILDDQKRVSLAHDFKADDDRVALNEGKQYAELYDVEIWQGSRMVARLTPEGKESAA